MALPTTTKPWPPSSKNANRNSRGNKGCPQFAFLPPTNYLGGRKDIPWPRFKIRKLPEWVVAHHKRNAERAGRSLEEELRQFLTEDALAKRDRLWRHLAETRARIRKRHSVLSDSTADIRDEREWLG